MWQCDTSSWMLHIQRAVSQLMNQKLKGLAQRVKRLPIMQETWVRSLGREDPLKKEMATHSSTLAWKIPWTEKPERLQSMGSQRIGHDWVTSLSFFLYCTASLLLLLLLFNHFSPVRLSVTLWTVARQAPLSVGFYRQEYWRGLPFPSPGDLSILPRD